MLPFPPVSGDAGIARLRSSRTSDKEAFKGRADVKYPAAVWTHEFKDEGLSGADGETGRRACKHSLALARSSGSFTPPDSGEHCAIVRTALLSDLTDVLGRNYRSR